MRERKKKKGGITRWIRYPRLNRSLAVFLFPAFFSLSFLSLIRVLGKSQWRSTLTSRLFLFPTIVFCSRGGRSSSSRQILEWENRNGAVRDTEGFIIGSRCTGHDIKLSYAHLGIFYYHRGAKEHAFPSGDTPRCSSFFIFSSSSFSRSSQRFCCQVTLTCLYF